MDTDAKILDVFKKNSGDFVSGEQISQMLRITRAAVWKHMDKLRDIGYEIEAVPHLGYRLRGVPDKMLPDEIKYELGTRIIGKEIYSFAKTGSTNTLAYDLAERGAREGTVVIAEQQDSGRGRMGRQWASPAGGIYLSVIIRPEIAPGQIQQFTLVAALSVVDAIKEVTGLDSRIKWPNDVFIDGKKVSGILSEMKAETDKIDFIIVGIGINANVSDKMIPPTGTSLKNIVEARVSRIDITKSLLRNLEREYLIFRSGGFASLRARVKEMSYTIGKRVSVTLHNAVSKGEAVDIDEDGALIIRADDGARKRILSGDVAQVR